MASGDAMRGSLFRFFVTGVTNTALTGLLMLAIAQWVEVDVAYTIVFVLGLTFTTVVTGRFVFRSQLTITAVRRFVAWYLCVYLVGITVVHLAEHRWHVSHVLTTVAVLTITAPLNFLGGGRAFLVSTMPSGV
jgi:putative flippase GtrA